jgi:DNA invertase Pin-like site-specific DNA recombinase
VLIGYVRVSSIDQNEGRQVDKMKALGIDERHIFIDKQSGKDFQREQYQLMKRMLRAGDLLYIDALDRLGRDYAGIIREWASITQETGADIVVLEQEELFDSRKFRSMGDIGKLMETQFLSLLAYVAEQERKKIRQRQAEGIALAKKEGRSLGRPKVDLPANFDEAVRRWRTGEITAVQAMKQTGMTRYAWYEYTKTV